MFDIEALTRAVGRIPPKARLTLLLVRLEGWTFEAVGKRIGVPAETAERLFERALEYLLEQRVIEHPRELEYLAETEGTRKPSPH